MRRALRIFPAYYAFLLIFLAVAALGLAPRADAAGFIAEFPWLLAYVANLRAFSADYVNSYAYSHLWTLSLEEQFYLVWPLAIWLTPAPRVMQLCLAALVTGIVFRTGFAAYALVAAPETRLLSFAVPRAPLCSVDAFAIGALALLARRGVAGVLRRAAVVTIVASIGAAAAATLAALFAPPGAVRSALDSSSLPAFATLAFGIPVLNLIAARLILALAAEGAPKDIVPRGFTGAMSSALLRLFDISLLQRLGVISYGFYIYHDPMLLLAGTAMEGSSLFVLFPVVAFALTILAASLSYRFIESPFLALKSRLPGLLHGGDKLGMARSG